MSYGTLLAQGKIYLSPPSQFHHKLYGKSECYILFAKGAGWINPDEQTSTVSLVTEPSLATNSTLSGGLTNDR